MVLLKDTSTIDINWGIELATLPATLPLGHCPLQTMNAAFTMVKEVEMPPFHAVPELKAAFRRLAYFPNAMFDVERICSV